MGGRSSSFKSSGGSSKEKTTIDEKTKIEKVEGGMSIDRSDNHNANPNYMGGRKALSEYNSERRKFNQLGSEIEQKMAMYKRHPTPGLKRELQTMISERKKRLDNLKNMKFVSRKYSVNCQRAVVAYELRRRGYKVAAQANDGSREGYKAAMLALKNREYVAIPRKISNRGPAVDRAIKSSLRKVGQRGVITFKWYKQRYGHTINVERTKNGILYVDAQTGMKSKSFRSYLSHTPGISQKQFTFARTDNQDLNIKSLVDSGVIKSNKN